jgi:hypothetical protein
MVSLAMAVGIIDRVWIDYEDSPPIDAVLHRAEDARTV